MSIWNIYFESISRDTLYKVIPPKVISKVLLINWKFNSGVLLFPWVDYTSSFFQGKVQVQSSDIQVGDLIIVEKVDAFSIYFRHVYTTY